MLFLIVFLLSVVFASFFGHLIHWAIHQKWSGPFHRSHMEHHLDLYPPGNLVSRTYRDAKWYHRGPFLFTPPLIVILGSVGGLLWWAGAPLWVLAVFAGSLVGFGLLNDYVHDSSHVHRHWLGHFRWFRKARALHFKHHRDMKTNFGIFFFGWDKLFGTYRGK